jgi:hypothetical protein
MATPAGLEPATTRLEGECSIQLSYGVEITNKSPNETSKSVQMAAAFRHCQQLRRRLLYPLS